MLIYKKDSPNIVKKNKVPSISNYLFTLVVQIGSDLVA